MEPVVFKGTRKGIAMFIDMSLEFEQLCEIIQQRLLQARDFLGDQTALIVNAGEHTLTDGEQLALKVLLHSLKHDVIEFVAKEEEKEIEETQEEEIVLPAEEALDESLGGSLSGVAKNLEMYFSDGSTLIVRKNIRSGQSIDFDGTLVIFGDVNAGAEIRATGHILVMGALRGMAHAGSSGNDQSVVYATKLLPVQLRIAELIARAPDNEDMDTTQPEMARIYDGHLLIEACMS